MNHRNDLRSFELLQPGSGGPLALGSATSFVASSDAERLGLVAAGLAAVALEPVTTRGELVLVAIPLPGHSVSVNGRTSAPLEVLRAGDLLLVDGCEACVALRLRPYRGPAAREDLDKICPLCLSSVRSAEIYVCPFCDTALHLAPDGADLSSALDCARVGSVCPVCSRAIRFDAEFVHAPSAN